MDEDLAGGQRWIKKRDLISLKYVLIKKGKVKRLLQSCKLEEGWSGQSKYRLKMFSILRCYPFGSGLEFSCF